MPNKLEAFLDSCCQAYYAGYPIISDAQFDNLADMAAYEKLGYATLGQKTAKHFKQMYSLQKVHKDDSNKESFKDPLGGIVDVVASPKLDGAAISLLYIDGKLVQVLTRGDGIEGLDKTDKFLATNIVPKVIETTLPILQVTGELAAGKHILNARNYASGALNLGSVDDFRTRAVSFFAYDCYPNMHDTYSQDIAYLSSLGFGTVKDKNLLEVYPIDGIVYRANSYTICEKLGYTAKHPKFAFALKDRQECVETEILSVEWNTGRTGRVTPVAILKPIEIDGKVISRATLNNPEFIEALGLCLGDTVGIRLAGMIIPEVVYKANA